MFASKQKFENFKFRLKNFNFYSFSIIYFILPSDAMESTAQLIIINECFMPATIQPRPALSDLFLHRRLPAISQRQPFE